MKGTDFFVKVLREPPFSEMHPKVGAFFKDYLEHEKVVKFNGGYVMNTHFPPYPSPAFDKMASHFNMIGDAGDRHLMSVTLAVTNRCMYDCWHCYNAGRSQQDMPLSVLKDLASQLQDLGVVDVTLSGGEPMLRPDLAEIAGAFDESVHIALNTTGVHLTKKKAEALRDNGVFCLGVSVDSIDPKEHDRMRGKDGAFETALYGLEIAAAAGLYPYIISVATHDFLEPERFYRFMQFASDNGALEVHLLEPSPSGKLKGRTDLLLGIDDKKRIQQYQNEIAQRDDLPILSSLAYIEGPGTFGCGAGLTHLYIDGSGEVCPCNFVPLSFGNVTEEPLTAILERMGCHFRKPRTSCIGHTMAKHMKGAHTPLTKEESAELCSKHLPEKHPLPRFFELRAEALDEVGVEDLKTSYNQVHEDYDSFWLSEAGKPIEELIERLSINGNERVFEAGCGTGFATALLGERLNESGSLKAVDISQGMLSQARARLKARQIENAHLVCADALDVMPINAGLDLVFSSWVLGYIPLKPFFAASGRALKDGGRLAFIVHKEDSPREALDIFWQLVGEDPGALEKKVVFDFPKDAEHLKSKLKAEGLQVDKLWDGKITFTYDSPQEVLDHLLRSGAGTVFYGAVAPDKREHLQKRFMEELVSRNNGRANFEVVHEYFSCVACKS